MIKQIELDPEQRDLLRNLMHAELISIIESLKNKDYSEQGIEKYSKKIYVMGLIQQKLLFEVYKDA